MTALVNRAGLTLRPGLPVYLQLRTSPCTAQNVAMGPILLKKVGSISL
jgi:hypothetical protein